MSGDQRPGQGPDPAEDDAVVPHPFGPGTLGERGAGPDDAVAEPEPEPESSASAPAPAPSPASSADQPAPENRVVEPPDGTTDEATDEGTRRMDPRGSAVPDGEHGPAPAAAPGDDAGEETAALPVTAEEEEPTRRRPRDPLAAALIGVLTLLLGFAFAVQVRAAGDDQQYAGAREEDLVRILDDLNAREERLRDQIADQRSALQDLTSSDSQSATALEEARARAEAIGILNGTIAAQGPGLVITIRDPDEEVRVSDVLDAIQELRGAGAETMQIDGVRVGVSTAITGTPGDLFVDGRPITAPYEFVVIGSPENMQTALNIPGGVVQDLTRQGASVDIAPSDRVVVDALRPLDTPQYASPDTDD